MNHILDDPNHGLRFAIIENEFGEVGVDEKILSENTNEEIIEDEWLYMLHGPRRSALNKLHDKISNSTL